MARLTTTKSINLFLLLVTCAFVGIWCIAHQYSSKMFHLSERYPCTQDNIQGMDFTKCLLTNDTNVLQSCFDQSFDGHQNEKLLKRFNLSNNYARHFDPVNNPKDKYLYLTLKQVEQLDNILQLHAFNNSSLTNRVDPTKPRWQNNLTNFRISDFANITQILHGAQPCDYDSGHYSGTNLTAIVFIITKPDDFKIRSLIRITWGAQFAAKQSTVRLYFTFGLPSSANRSKSELDSLDQLVREESDQFGDIIQWNFEDGYYRLTIKSVAMLRWASVYCPLVPVVLKSDPDCIINYNNLVKFTEQVLLNLNNSHYIYGNLFRRPAVHRSTASKYFTSFANYPLKRYPDFVACSWYLAGRSLPLFMYRNAILHSMPAFLLEDVFVTGIVAQKMIDAKFPLERRQMDGHVHIWDYKRIDFHLYNQSIILSQGVDESNLPQVWARIKQGEMSTKQSK